MAVEMCIRDSIHISKRAYNQLELFVGSFPGNCYTLNEEYDRFQMCIRDSLSFWASKAGIYIGRR